MSLQTREDYDKYLKEKLAEANSFTNASLACSTHGSIQYPLNTKGYIE
jgi:hypothetical protein